MFAFGVSNHSPDQVIKFLTLNRVIKDPSEIAVVPVGAILNPEKKLRRKVIFMVSISDFFRNIAVLNAKAAGHLVFLFASPLRVNEILGMTALDFSPDEEYQGMGYRLTALDPAKLTHMLKQPESQDVKRDTGNYLSRLIESIKHGSLLNPLMTFIYTLPRASHQTPVKEIVAHGIYNGWRTDRVFEQIGATKLSLTPKAADRLEDILNSEVSTTFKAAFVEYRKSKTAGKVNLKSIATKHNVSDYEMRYIVSVLESKKNRGPIRGKSIASIPQKELVG